MGVPEHSKARSSIQRSFEQTKLRIFNSFDPALLLPNKTGTNLLELVSNSNSAKSAMR